MCTISTWKLDLLGRKHEISNKKKHICFPHSLTKWPQSTRNYMDIKMKYPWRLSGYRRYFNWYFKITTH